MVSTFSGAKPMGVINTVNRFTKIPKAFSSTAEPVVENAPSPDFVFFVFCFSLAYCVWMFLSFYSISLAVLNRKYTLMLVCICT